MSSGEDNNDYYYDDRDVDDLGDYYSDEELRDYEDEESEEKGKEKEKEITITPSRLLLVTENNKIYPLDMDELYKAFTRTNNLINPYTGIDLSAEDRNKVLDYGNRFKPQYETYSSAYQGCDEDENGYVIDSISLSPIPKGRVVRLRSENGEYYCFDIESLFEEYLTTGSDTTQFIDNPEPYDDDTFDRIKNYEYITIVEDGEEYHINIKETYNYYIREGKLINPDTGKILSEEENRQKVYDYGERMEEQRKEKEEKEGDYEPFDPVLHKGCEDENGYVIDAFTANRIPKGRLVTVKSGDEYNCFDIDSLYQNYIRSKSLINPFTRELFPKDVIDKIKSYKTTVKIIVDQSRSASLEKTSLIGEVFITAIKIRKGLSEIGEWSALLSIGDLIYDIEELNLKSKIIDISAEESIINIDLISDPPEHPSKSFLRKLRDFIIEISVDKKIDMVYSLTYELGEDANAWYLYVIGEEPKPIEMIYEKKEEKGEGYYDDDFDAIANIPDVAVSPLINPDRMRAELRHGYGSPVYVMSDSNFSLLIRFGDVQTIEEKLRQAELIREYVNKRGMEGLSDVGFPYGEYPEFVIDTIVALIEKNIKNATPTGSVFSTSLDSMLEKIIDGNIKSLDLKYLMINQLLSKYNKVTGNKMSKHALKYIIYLPYISDVIESMKCEIVKLIFSSNLGTRTELVSDIDKDRLTVGMKKCLNV